MTSTVAAAAMSHMPLSSRLERSRQAWRSSRLPSCRRQTRLLYTAHRERGYARRGAAMSEGWDWITEIAEARSQEPDAAAERVRS
jgi:hypothetical protein